ncbi:Methyltransferase FkbM domain protein [uncultured archaeon]|nr:Methyltransferase FkbM domain protein [uncultured archaeon]
MIRTLKTEEGIQYPSGINQENAEILIDEVKNTYFKDIKYSKNDIVFDIGANIGVFTYLVAPKVKMVYSFEPEKNNFKILRLNSHFSNVKIFNNAVTNKEIGIDLYVDKGNIGGHSIFNNNKILDKPEKVQTLNLQKLIDKYKPTILKIDIEGSEYLFQNINFKTVKKIYIEFHLNCTFGNFEAEYIKLKNKLLTDGFKIVNEVEHCFKNDGILNCISNLFVKK